VKAHSILYHDVVGEGDFDQSGFPGPEAARYKLTRAQFLKHLQIIKETVKTSPATADQFLTNSGPNNSWLLHFDDGGLSAIDTIAPMLNKLGWKGHFYIPTDYIGRAGFVDAAQVRDLRKQGHVIGSHSCSHPVKISQLNWDAVLAEWTRSKRVLSEILGEEVQVASIPGGFYSRRVAQAAADAGIKILFTSEPVSSPTHTQQFSLFGRYSIVDRTTAHEAAALVSEGNGARRKQYLFWNAKKAAKVMVGPAYAALRRYLLKRKRA
jgi:peptidoglycan/xylan/chitin deacetylase (PgdA/CDA1 family)